VSRTGFDHDDLLNKELSLKRLWSVDTEMCGQDMEEWPNVLQVNTKRYESCSRPKGGRPRSMWNSEKPEVVLLLELEEEDKIHRHFLGVPMFPRTPHSLPISVFLGLVVL
jgi:hypothetical protein